MASLDSQPGGPPPEPPAPRRSVPSASTSRRPSRERCGLRAASQGSPADPTPSAVPGNRQPW
eukprot:scaffold731_cov261-Pinguiococcus_pyrenoidosus.AAC.109